MATRDRVEADRLALTEAIESKIHRLGVEALLKLAAELNVRIPPSLKKGRGAAGAARKETTKGEKSRKGRRVLAGGGVGPVLSAAEAGRVLEAISVDDETADWAASELLGAGEVVQRLKISRGTLDNWRKSGKIIAFRKGLRNYLYPARQFFRLRPLEGLAEVAAHFASPEDAWDWLLAPNRMTAGKAPLEFLRKGHVEQVTAAAEGALDFA